MAGPEAAPFRDVNFMPRDLRVDERPDGTIVLASRVDLRPCEPHLPAYLRKHAKFEGAAPWLSQRRGPDRLWRTVSFGEARAVVDNLTQALLDLGPVDGRPLAILSGNSIEHAMITLAAMQARIPVAPISAAYSLQSSDFLKLKLMVDLLEPQFIFVQSGQTFARALEALDLQGAHVIHVDDAAPGCASVAYSALAATPATPAVDRSIAAIDPDATAKYMFTSGSTGAPKAVMQTQRTVCVAAESTLQGMGHVAGAPVVKLDWTPWNHVFGAMGLGTTLVAGGSFFIDDGKPVEPLFAETLRNLRDVAPTTYGSVPAGFAALVPALEQDDDLARKFFSRLEYASYAGARLPDELAARFQALAVKFTGFRLPFTAGYGATETGPVGALVHWATDRVGLIGLPPPAVEMKLVPLDAERYEVRIRSVAVMPGYYRQPELTAAAFDEEGFYRIGDTASFVDREDVYEGLAFAGRISEEFKLQTGIFVRAGALRTQVLDAAAPLLQDAVICGEDQPYVAVMAWVNVAAGRALAGLPNATLPELNRAPQVRLAAAKALGEHNRRNPASSQRVARLLLLDDPPSIDRGEVTDKGSINQRAVQRDRARFVSSLFEPDPPAEVIRVDPPARMASANASDTALQGS